MIKFKNKFKITIFMDGMYFLGYIEAKEQRFLKSINDVKKAVLGVCKAMGLKVVGEKHHVFKSPNGITYCFILSQSHFVVHTWPEERRIFFDIFTCGKGLDDKKCIGALSKKFKGEVKEIRKVGYK